MTQNDEQMLEQFFQEARQKQVADNGFTEKVMRRVPDRSAMRLSHLWTAFCLLACVALFVFGRGWDIVAAGILQLVATPPTVITLLQVMAAFSFLTIFVGVELLHRERMLRLP